MIDSSTIPDADARAIPTGVGDGADRVTLIGECNPYGDDPDMALYPAPDGCSGHRLWRVLGVSRERYLAFTRVNLCEGLFRMANARDRAAWLRANIVAHDYARFYGHDYARSYGTSDDDPSRLVILCGSRVREAFGLQAIATWSWWRDPSGNTWLALPHPSGRSRVWGPGMWGPGGSVARTRETLRSIAPRVPWGEDQVQDRDEVRMQGEDEALMLLIVDLLRDAHLRLGELLERVNADLPVVIDRRVVETAVSLLVRQGRVALGPDSRLVLGEVGDGQR
jgi:hypothetical protein